MQAPDPDYFLVLFIHDAPGAREGFLPLFVGDFIGIDFVLFQELARHKIRVATEQDVRTAAGHVGGDRDRALAARLGDDFGFALVIFGVQNVMRHTLADQAAGNQLRILY